MPPTPSRIAEDLRGQLVGEVLKAFIYPQQSKRRQADEINGCHHAATFSVSFA